MSSPLVLRAATVADLDAVGAIERASFSDPWPRTFFADALAGRGVRFEVAATQEGEVTGYVIAAFVADQGEILNLAVASAHRRAHLGSRFLDRVIQAARSEGIVTLHLEVRESNAAARALYARAGFREAGRRRAYYRHPTEDALLLRVDLGENAVGPAAATG